MAAIWKPWEGVTIKDVERVNFLFQFFPKLDMQSITNGVPWYFDNQLLILDKLKPNDVPDQVKLNHVSFWAQIHNILVAFMSENVGKYLANINGEFLEYDPNNNSGGWRSYMRVGVIGDVHVPLKKVKKVKKPSRDWKVMAFKYERFGTFFFLCGFFDHAEKFCSLHFEWEEYNHVWGWGLEIRVENHKFWHTVGNKWLRDDNDKKVGFNECGNRNSGGNYKGNHYSDCDNNGKEGQNQ